MAAKVNLNALEAGKVLTARDGRRYRVSDWSPGTGSIFGHPYIGETDELGPYGSIPFKLARS